MLIKVVLIGEYKRLMGGRGGLEVELPEGSTVQRLVQEVAALGGDAFAQKVITTEGRVLPGVTIFVNGHILDTGGTRPSRTVLSGGLVEIMHLSSLG